MDPEKAREKLRTDLETVGADVTLFEDPDLDRLLEARYRNARALRGASWKGLTSTGLSSGLIDQILSLKGGAAADPGPKSSAPADVARKDQVDGKQLLAEWYRGVTGPKEKTLWLVATRMGLACAVLALFLAASAWGIACDSVSLAAGVLGFVLVLPWTLGQLTFVWSIRTRGHTYAAASCSYIGASFASVAAAVAAVLAARSSGSAVWNAAALLAILLHIQHVLLPAMNGVAELGILFFDNDTDATWASAGSDALLTAPSEAWAAARHVWTSCVSSTPGPAQVVPADGRRAPARLDSPQ